MALLTKGKCQSLSDNLMKGKGVFMNGFNFSENIIRLRREKKITQEQLADFMGVTKSSVSKWETKQSLPDMLLLPQLASFFDITIDELLGYEPQLGKEQIQKIYLDLAGDFAKEPFEKVMEQCERMVKQYYSCYPFLYQICVLLLNHFMLAEGEVRQKEILVYGSDLCSRIIENCKDIALCNDAVFLNASIILQLGNAGEVIASLEELENPCRLSKQGAGILLQAYQMTGEMDKANHFAQISMYQQVIALVGCATQYLAIHSDNLSICEETLHRITAVAEVYDLEHLHSNVIALFYYQGAITYCIHDRKTEALQLLQKFVYCVEQILQGDVVNLHGDTYFDKLDIWIEQLDLAGNAPRDKKIICESGMQALRHPAVAILEKEESYQFMEKQLAGIYERICNGLEP